MVIISSSPISHKAMYALQTGSYTSVPVTSSSAPSLFLGRKLMQLPGGDVTTIFNTQIMSGEPVPACTQQQRSLYLLTHSISTILLS